MAEWPMLRTNAHDCGRLETYDYVLSEKPLVRGDGADFARALRRLAVASAEL